MSSSSQLRWFVGAVAVLTACVGDSNVTPPDGGSDATAEPDSCGAPVFCKDAAQDSSDAGDASTIVDPTTLKNKGLIVWLDARAGLTLGGDAGANVTAWADQSGGGNNAVHTSPCTDPTQEKANLAGHDTVGFVATSATCLGITNTVFKGIGTGDFAMFAVVRYANVIDGGVDYGGTFFEVGNVLENTTYFRLIGNSTTAAGLYAQYNNGSTPQSLAFNGAVNDDQWHVIGMRRSGGMTTVYVDAQTGGPTSAGQGYDLGQAAGTSALIGASVVSTLQERLQGSIAEMIVLDVAVSDATATGLVAYFKSRWSI